MTLARIALLVIALVANQQASAQAFPSRPVRILNGFQAGGPPDIALRRIAARSWWGIVGPAGMPAAIVSRLHDEIAAALAEPDLQTTMAQWGIVPTGGTSESFGNHIKLESTRWKERVTQLGVKPE